MDEFTKANLAHSRKQASRTRAGYLMSVAGGVLTVDDVLASYPKEQALGSVSLVQLLSAQPDVSHQEAKRLVERFRHFAKMRFAGSNSRNIPKVPERPTISYLRHAQSNILPRLWDEALHPGPNPPWEGFPYRTRPDDAVVAQVANDEPDDFGF